MDNRAIAVADQLLLFVDSKKEVQVFPHVRVDGDCLGSAAAIAMTLQKLRVRVKIYMDEPIPERLYFLEIQPGLYEIFDTNKMSEYRSLQGAVLSVDCSEADRMGHSGALFMESPIVLVIDHHVSSGKSSGFQYVDSKAAAASELVFDVIRILEEKSGEILLDSDIANCLMVGLQSDTGRFSFQNTTSRTFRAAAELLECGANVYINAYNLFDVTNVERMRLTSKALSNAKLFFGGKLALTVVTQEMIRECKTTEDAADGLAANLRDIEGVIVSFVIRETSDGETRVNIRSYDPFDAAAFAYAFNGGGHHRAAGFSIPNMSVNEVFRAIIEKAGDYLSEPE